MELLYGVGINDVDYVTQIREGMGYVDGKRKRKLVWICPFYKLWINMLRRCYDEKELMRQPTYRGCSVTQEWHSLSRFKKWVETQDYVGKCLDKDILSVGNKVYSPTTCAFISQPTNSFVTVNFSTQGDFPVGVSYHKLTNKFQASCNNPITKKQNYLGLYVTPEEAHEVWRKHKHELAQLVAETETDPRVVAALQKRYSYDEWYRHNPICS